MAPYKYRGSLNIGFQLSITIGIVVANVLNYFFNKLHGNMGWRLSLGGELVPALIITVGSLILPKTPNSMIERGKQDEVKTSDSSTFVGQVKEVKVLTPEESTSMATSSRTMPDYLQGGPKMKSSYRDLPSTTSVIENVTFVSDTCQLLGCGDTGIVYLAELVGTNLRYDIKVMENGFLERRKKMARAHIEQEILRILDLPFLPTLYAHFVSDNLSCLVTDYCPGGDLHVLRQKQPDRYYHEQAAR
ncbi:serine/threonine-protein kinase D6PK-like protein [Tanacetum coccineum]